MDTPYSYQYLRDTTTGMWRILSPSGHLLYESRWHVHVARVCQRLKRPLYQAASGSGRDRWLPQRLFATGAAGVIGGPVARLAQSGGTP